MNTPGADNRSSVERHIARCGFGRWLLVFGILWLALHGASAATVEIAVHHVVAGEPLQFGSMRYGTSANEVFSVTRWSYLLGDFAFQREDGTWLELSNSVAWFDAEKQRTTTRLELPHDTYRTVRFSVGLNTNLNHADVTQFGPEHPLNPNLNGLHWSWQGGYVFAALEGLWRDNGALSGWSFHLARDTNSSVVVLAAGIALTNSAKLELDFDLASVLNAPRPLSFAKDGSSTHSRDGDPIAAALVKNLRGAFRVRRVSKIEGETEAVKNGAGVFARLSMPAAFTPHRFEMSATFPVPELPRDNPLIQERVALGEKLFNETLLSRDGTVSCASCHDRKVAFADPRQFSVGVSNRLGARNAMPLFNLAWKSSFFWDGRARSLREQALMPVQDHAEMDESLTNVIAKLRTALYPQLFAKAFDSADITADRIGLALESFLLTITSFDSKFDRAIRGEEAFTAQEKRGFELFMTEFDPRRGQFGADCFHCHGGPLFQSQQFANNGLDPQPKDHGRGKITGKVSDLGKFATPSLRNVALTAPYMHDGRFTTLEEVVGHYSTGVKRSATLDPNLAKHPDGGLRLTSEDTQAIIAFLKTLTDERFGRGQFARSE